MNSFKSTIKIFTFFVFVFAFASMAQAQTRTWVSGVGDDANPCSRTAPCKTFAGAISKTATNGEINCLDPGGYGAVTITKSITIDCEDTQGSILASLTNGLIVNGAGVDVRLRGLSIAGAGNGINCVRMIQGGKLTLDEVVCNGFTQHGVSIENSSGAFSLVVRNSSFRNLSGNGINTFVTGTGSASVAVGSSLFAFTNIAINFGVSAKGAVHDSTITNNGTGLRADGATSNLSAQNNQISHNTTGVFAANGGNVRIGGNLITGNGTGLSGANILSFGQNSVDGNTVNGAITGPAAVQ
ncbi:MAG: right-handed parallel beta-helix repeat-containing protein [Pyrinomonadaceae bacterium]